MPCSLEMAVLVTGGAGFIGSHVVARLLAQGEDVVVLDSLEEQVHGGHPPVVEDGVRLVKGDVGDARAAAEALEGVDRVVHLAAAVGVGQSMYEIARYAYSNTYATAAFFEQLVERAADARPFRRRVVDVDLRRGRLPVPRARPNGAAAEAGGAAAGSAVGAALRALQSESSSRSRRPRRSRSSRPRCTR